MKRISAWAAIPIAPTVIGSIYGMNFDTMPELHWAGRYPAPLGADGGCFLYSVACFQTGKVAVRMRGLRSSLKVMCAVRSQHLSRWQSAS
ncbi:MULTISPECIES: CorA family divalent cation transporter [unclassified Rothia (in: high G+C Gram-positive bacteria)]|uniref:CorA family divalent cation transporter n=1 Tax=unclassified Rothia (in: high G+C Gram-positive bacteria) TaxID=2689056 RepID=UPI001EF43A22|nr:MULTISPECIES: CorA family divalent cation transporter [unclassified Rothia (in: high G+C Gram-positive bacteria)]